MLYMREKFLDDSKGLLDVLSTVHINQCVKELVRKNVLRKEHILALHMHISGYSLAEIETRLPNARELLYFAYAVCAEATGYTDASFVNMALNYYPKFRVVAPALLKQMTIKGKETL